MSVFEVNRNPSEKDLRSFGLVMLIGLFVIGVALWLVSWGFADPEREILSWTGERAQIFVIAMWILGAVLFALSRVSLAATKTVYVNWMSVAVPVGKFMTSVGLTVLFVTVLPFFSLIRFSDPMRKKLKSEGSYWEDAKPHEPTIERMMRPF